MRARWQRWHPPAPDVCGTWRDARGPTPASPCRLAAARSAPEPQQPKLTGFATFGFDALVGDYRWLQAVQVVGNEQADLIGAAPAIQRPDRRGRRARSLRRSSVPLRVALARQRHRAGARRQRILERGIAYHPNDWRNRFYLSFNHFFYLGDVEAAARELEARRRPPGAPRYLGQPARSSAFGERRSRSGRAYLERAAAADRRSLEAGRVRARRSTRSRPSDGPAISIRRARCIRERDGRDIEKVEDLATGSAADAQRAAARNSTAGAGFSTPQTGRDRVVVLRSPLRSEHAAKSTASASSSGPGAIRSRRRRGDSPVSDRDTVVSVEGLVKDVPQRLLLRGEARTARRLLLGPRGRDLRLRRARTARARPRR